MILSENDGKMILLRTDHLRYDRYQIGLLYRHSTMVRL